MQRAVSKQRWVWSDGKSTRNRTYNTITKHFIVKPTKSIHITMLVLLKVDFSNINLFFAFRNKIRYFNTTCDTLLRWTLGNSESVFRKNFSFINVFVQFFDSYHFKFGMRKIMWRKKSNGKYYKIHFLLPYQWRHRPLKYKKAIIM